MKWSQHRALDGDTVHEGTVGGVSGGIDPAARSRVATTGDRHPLAATPNVTLQT